jgi:predicted membrane channel-forming protein YqfA (hemolysin III family)
LAVLVPGRRRRVLLALVWPVASIGAFSKALPTLPRFSMTILIYGASAAIGCLPVVELAHVVGPRGLAWVAGGAVVYAIGATCEAVR